MTPYLVIPRRTKVTLVVRYNIDMSVTESKQSAAPLLFLQLLQVSQSFLQAFLFFRQLHSRNNRQRLFQEFQAPAETISTVVPSVVEHAKLFEEPREQARIAKRVGLGQHLATRIP